jgi:hypothetical protein
MPRLTDQERQDIQRYLDSDKSLPDKYRFLLFDDKREVELVWNGKTAIWKHQPYEQRKKPCDSLVRCAGKVETVPCPSTVHPHGRPTNTRA